MSKSKVQPSKMHAFIERNKPDHNDFDSGEWKSFVAELALMKSFVQAIKSRLKNFASYIENFPGTDRSTQVYNYLHDKKEKPVCKMCGGPVRLRGITIGYQSYCSNKCNMNDPETQEKREKSKRETNLKVYGVENPMQSESVRAEYRKSMLERTGKDNPLALEEVIAKTRATKIKNGTWIPDEERSRFEIYKLAVRRETQRQPIHLLEHHEQRGKKKGQYSLDHRYSKYEGYKNGIDPKIIGNIVNLEYIPVSKNCSKMSQCSISKEELLRLYINNSKNQAM